MTDTPTTDLPPHDDLIVHCIGVAAMEIRKIADPRRRKQVAHNAAAALRDAVSNG